MAPLDALVSGVVLVQRQGLLAPEQAVVVEPEQEQVLVLGQAQAQGIQSILKGTVRYDTGRDTRRIEFPWYTVVDRSNFQPVRNCRLPYAHG